MESQPLEIDFIIKAVYHCVISRNHLAMNAAVAKTFFLSDFFGMQENLYNIDFLNRKDTILKSIMV